MATNEVKNKCACAFTEPGAALEENLGMEVVVYPNPNYGQFKVALSEGLQLESMALVDVSGKTTSLSFVAVNEKEFQVQLDVLESGFYWLVLQTNQGKVFKQLELIH